jgi:CDP-diglyceride synthetase
MDEIRTFGEEVSMSRESKKSVSWTIVLVLLGLLAFYGGTRWLLVLIPLALMIWAIRPAVRAGRN